MSSRAQTLKFVRNTPTSTLSIQGNAVNPILGGGSFSLSSASGASELTALFDSYRIDKVDVAIYNRVNPSAQTAAAAAYPRFHYVFDRDDATAPPTLDDLMQHQGVKTHIFDEGHNTLKFSISPRVATALWAGGAFSGYGTPDKPMFVDCANPAVPHYGWKYGVEIMTNTNYFLDVYYTFHFTMRDPR